jgi:hypothetical protein
MSVELNFDIPYFFFRLLEKTLRIVIEMGRKLIILITL